MNAVSIKLKCWHRRIIKKVALRISSAYLLARAINRPNDSFCRNGTGLTPRVRQLAVEAGKQERLLNRSIPLESVAKELELDPDGVESVMVLRKLRNDVAHATAPPLSSDDAERFSDAVERILFYLKEKTAAARFRLTPPAPSAQ